MLKGWRIYWRDSSPCRWRIYWRDSSPNGTSIGGEADLAADLAMLSHAEEADLAADLKSIAMSLSRKLHLIALTRTALSVWNLAAEKRE